MLHEGHRERLRAKATEYGIECLEDHEALELLLGYAIPRRNTNEMAHELINMSGSLSEVFEAESGALKKVSGMGDYSVFLIKLVRHIMRRPQQKSVGKIDLSKFSNVCKYAATLFVTSEKEVLYALLLDKKMRLIKPIKITSENSWQVEIDKKVILKAAVEEGAAALLLMHNHPGGVSRPSIEDINFTVGMERACSAIDLPFVEHIVYADGDCHPIMMRSKLKSTKSVEYDNLKFE